MKETEKCFRCKEKPIWKGNKNYRNYWGLYCDECEKIKQQEIDNVFKSK